MQQWHGWCSYNGSTAAYRLDCKSKCRFYKRVLFDLIDVALVNSHIVYTKLDNGISLLNFKIAAAKAWNGRYSNRKRSFPPRKHKSHEPSIPREVPTHMLEYQEKGIGCLYFKNEAQITKRLCPVRQGYGLHLCLTKNRNCVFEASFVVFHHDYIVFLLIPWFLFIINMSNIPTHFKFNKECIDSIAVIVKIYL